MIENEDQLEQSTKALDAVKDALEALRKRVQPKNPKLFEAMSLDYLSNIDKLQSDINVYRRAHERQI